VNINLVMQMLLGHIPGVSSQVILLKMNELCSRHSPILLLYF